MKSYLLLLLAIQTFFTGKTDAEKPALEAYRFCHTASECALGLDPCGQLLGINRDYRSEFAQWAANTPRSCAFTGRSDPTHLICVHDRCEAIQSSDSENVKKLMADDFPPGYIKSAERLNEKTIQRAVTGTK